MSSEFIELDTKLGITKQTIAAQAQSDPIQKQLEYEKLTQILLKYVKERKKHFSLRALQCINAAIKSEKQGLIKEVFTEIDKNIFNDFNIAQKAIYLKQKSEYSFN